MCTWRIDGIEATGLLAGFLSRAVSDPVQLNRHYGQVFRFSVGKNFFIPREENRTLPTGRGDKNPIGRIAVEYARQAAAIHGDLGGQGEQSKSWRAQRLVDP